MAGDGGELGRTSSCTRAARQSKATSRQLAHARELGISAARVRDGLLACNAHKVGSTPVNSQQDVPHVPRQEALPPQDLKVYCQICPSCLNILHKILPSIFILSRWIGGDKWSKII